MLKELDLHVTNRCNLHCSTCCFASGKADEHELITSELLLAVEQAREMGCEEVHITGGEPLMRDDLGVLVEKIRAKGMSVRLQTNGILLNKEEARKLSSVGLSDVMISLDSHLEEHNTVMRGSGARQAALDAVKTAVGQGMRVRVNAVATAINRETFPEMLRFLDQLGVSVFSLFYFSPIGRGYQHPEMWLSPYEYLSLTAEIGHYVAANARRLKMEVIAEKAYATWEEAQAMSRKGFSGSGGGCTHVLESRDYLILRSNGDVFPCIMMLATARPLGNVREIPLEEIRALSPQWQQSDRAKAKASCGICEHEDFCGGGCAGYAQLFSDRLSAADPRCIKGRIVPLCPIMKTELSSGKLGGSSRDVSRSMS